MLNRVKQKLNSIPIFFEEEKEYILTKISWKSEDFLKLVYEELINVENHVEQDKEKLQKQIKEIEDKLKVEMESKKREIIRKMIQKAEEEDDD